MIQIRGLHVLVLSCLMFFPEGCGSMIYADGPHHGRVIDKETKQPIEGAAVLAVWWKETPMIGHPMQSVHDVQETATDKDGNFTIPGTSTFSPISRIHEPLFTIFKPDYQAYGYNGGWKLQSPGRDGRTVVELGALRTREERLENQGRVSVSDCDRNEKCPNLIRLINVERSNLGLKPIGPIKKGVKQ